MRTLQNKVFRDSRSGAFFRKSLQTLSESTVGHGLIHNGRIGLKNYQRFFIGILKGLNTGFHLYWEESGTQETIRRGERFLGKIQEKIALNLNASPQTLSLIFFLFLAQMIILPLSSALGPSANIPVWSSILVTLWLLFLLGKKSGCAVKNNGPAIFWMIITINALFAAFTFRRDYYLLTSLYLISAWLSARVLTKDNVRTVMKYMVYSSPLWILLGIAQKIAGAPTPPGWVGVGQDWFIAVRIYSVFKNPNVFSLYLIIILIWAYYLRLQALRCENGSNPKRIEWIFGGVILLDSIGLYFTYSRIAWLIAAVLLIIWNKNHFDRKTWLGVVGFAAAAFWLLPDLQSRLLSVGGDSSIWQRVDIWKGVGKAIKEYGWWGAGPGNFYAAFAMVGSPAVSWVQHAHQQYLQIWLENGLLGIFAFFAIIIKGIPRFFGEDLIVKAMGLTLAAYLIYGLTETWTASPFLGGLFWLMMGFGDASLSGIVRGGSPEVK